jgi:Zn-dependent protease with chaperone function
VLAHEISHIVNRDMTVITIAQFIPMIASYLMNSLMWMGLFGGGRDRDDRGGNSFIIVYLATILVYWISTLLVMALSRYREYSADRTGAIVTGAPSQLATALMKISGLIRNSRTGPAPGAACKRLLPDPRRARRWDRRVVLNAPKRREARGAPAAAAARDREWSAVKIKPTPFATVGAFN